MKYLSVINVFKFSWDQVAVGFWHRYPNPQSAHVVCEDTLSRRVIGDRLYTTRLIGKSSAGRLPRWGERLIGSRGRLFFIVEESVVDRRARTITTYSRNIGLTKILTVEEKCVYRRDDASPSAHTLCERQAWVDSRVRGFSFALQRFGFERFRRNVARTNDGFQHVLQTLFPAAAAAATAAKSPVSHSHQRATLRRNAKKATELAKSRAAAIVGTKC